MYSLKIKQQDQWVCLEYQALSGGNCCETDALVQQTGTEMYVNNMGLDFPSFALPAWNHWTELLVDLRHPSSAAQKQELLSFQS